MRTAFRLFFLVGFFGIVKAHGFIRLVILAAMGLAGLWMVHTLAQDFQNISNNGKGGIGRFLQKRSINDFRQFQINWELVLSKDPASCTRSFICQLAATETKDLDDIGLNILKLTRNQINDSSWASRQLLEALKEGENIQNPRQCMKIYRMCPYSAQTMVSLLKIFG